MALESAILYSARDGRLHHLKFLLDHRLNDAPLLVSTKTNNSTPLLLACINGHLDVVLYLIEKCRANIEQVGSVVLRSHGGIRVDEATPLWCAAINGHLDIVKYLLRCRAYVNRATASQCTPLHAACAFGYLEVAQYLIENGANFDMADNVGHTSLMIACFMGHDEIAKYLIECGASVNRKSNSGNIALHNCAELGNIDELKPLLQNEATFIINSSGKSPLLSAALFGQAETIKNFILKINFTKEVKINLLELLGASFVDDYQRLTLAFECWRIAMILRYEDKDSLVLKPKDGSCLASFVGASEVQTLDQLERIASNPEEIRLQALLIRDRILGPAHPDNLKYIGKRGKPIHENNFVMDRSVLLWQYHAHWSSGTFF